MDIYICRTKKHILCIQAKKKKKKKKKKMMVNIDKRPMIILVPYPAQGHVTPMLHLATALSSRGFQPVVAVPDFIYHHLSSQTHAFGTNIIFKSIISNLKEGSMDFFSIDQAMENHMPEEFNCILKEPGFKGRIDCVVVDLLASWAIGVAERNGIKVSGFWTAMLNTYRVISAIPELIQRGLISDSGTPLYEEEVIATKLKHSIKDLPWLVGDTASQKSRFKFWLRTMRRTYTLSSLLVNSFANEYLDESSINGLQIFHVGPLLLNNHPQIDGSTDCIKWLNKQDRNTVIYVSFGTWVGSIGQEKITELALGLEESNRPFIWALKDDPEWRSGLPKGFVDRVKGRGKIVGWAPQEAVLGHDAVGCYVTHCGWNSTMEGIKHGKRMVCYPVSGDQFLNCDFIVKVWGIGVRVKGFGRSDVEESVEDVMVGDIGKVVQGRVLKLKERVMGVEGRLKAKESLHLFLHALKKH